ncbi:MAG: D-hexose-6-phosphate mutarotase [Gammaproteobacteria bacterium]|nr:D-hexose-6-phosphate mutarotase [Gammaproteobacteria bacterium]
MRVTDGIGGLSKIVIETADAMAEIYLHGGQLTSWRVRGREQLFLSSKSEFRSGAAIRGGVPVVFPQFSSLGTLPKHGLARTAAWQVIDTVTAAEFARVRLALHDSPSTRVLWPYSFALELQITIGGDALELVMSVTNTGAEPFRFTAALHTYIKIADLDTLRIAGLGGRPYADAAHGGATRVQHDGLLALEGEVDRIYTGVSGPLNVIDARHALQIHAAGFEDVVIWNPGATKAAALADLEPGGERAMVCVEAAAIAVPVVLAPTAFWRGTQRLTVRDEASANG